MTPTEFAGDPQHPDHDAWLLELGRATYEAARVAGICFDILRIHGNETSDSLYADPLGTLIKKLRRLASRPDAPAGLDGFLTALDDARDARNDLLHALPVANGLHRRRKDDPTYVRDLYSVASLRELTEVLTLADRLGSEVLYYDGGQAIREWYARTT